MTPRRISIVGPLWPYRGGIAHFSAALAKALATRGHPVRAVTFRRQYPGWLFPGVSQVETGPAPEGAPLADRWLDTLNPLTWSRTARHIHRDGADVALIPFWMPFFAPMLGVVARRLRTRGVRVLALVHNALPHEPRPGDRALVRSFLKACDGAVVLSDRVRSDVERLAPTLPIQSSVHPVYDVFGDPMPRAQARDALGLAHDAPVFLFFGFIRRYKGLHVLLDAFRAVVDRVPTAVLLVAGEFYADEEALRTQAEALGAAVRFDAAYIPNDAVPAYFSAADAVVQPYVSATQSGVAQIAFHFGRPVVTTDVGGLAESVPDGVAGLVVPPNDAGALAEALVRLASDDGLSLRLARGADRQRAAATWERLAIDVETLMTEVGIAP